MQIVATTCAAAHRYKHNVRAAAQCEVSWTSAFLLSRALTDVLVLSALRGVQHVTICTFQFLQELFVVHFLFS